MREHWARLRRAALLSLAVHLAAGLAMALVLRRGLETNPDLADRLAFIAERRWAWTASWALWNAAAFSIVWLFYALRRARGGRWLRLALAVAASAAVADLSAEWIEMGLIPRLAADALSDPLARPLFLAVHRLAELLTGFLANGLYTAALLLAVGAAWKDTPRRTRLAGAAAGAGGLVLSAAALAGSAMGMVLANAALVPALLLWQWGLAEDARARI